MTSNDGKGKPSAFSLFTRGNPRGDKAVPASFLQSVIAQPATHQAGRLFQQSLPRQFTTPAMASNNPGAPSSGTCNVGLSGLANSGSQSTIQPRRTSVQSLAALTTKTQPSTPQLNPPAVQPNLPSIQATPPHDPVGQVLESSKQKKRRENRERDNPVEWLPSMVPDPDQTTVYRAIYATTTHDSLPPPGVELEDCQVLDLARLVDNGDLGKGFVSKTWPSTFTSKGVINTGRKAVGRPGVVISGGRAFYAIVGGRTLLVGEGHANVFRAQDRNKPESLPGWRSREFYVNTWKANHPGVDADNMPWVGVSSEPYNAGLVTWPTTIDFSRIPPNALRQVAGLQLDGASWPPALHFCRSVEAASDFGLVEQPFSVDQTSLLQADQTYTLPGIDSDVVFSATVLSERFWKLSQDHQAFPAHAVAAPLWRMDNSLDILERAQRHKFGSQNTTGKNRHHATPLTTDTQSYAGKGKGVEKATPPPDLSSDLARQSAQHGSQTSYEVETQDEIQAEFDRFWTEEEDNVALQWSTAHRLVSVAEGAIQAALQAERAAAEAGCATAASLAARGYPVAIRTRSVYQEGGPAQAMLAHIIQGVKLHQDMDSLEGVVQELLMPFRVAHVGRATVEAIEPEISLAQARKEVLSRSPSQEDLLSAYGDLRTDLPEPDSRVTPENQIKTLGTIPSKRLVDYDSSDDERADIASLGEKQAGDHTSSEKPKRKKSTCPLNYDKLHSLRQRKESKNYRI